MIEENSLSLVNTVDNDDKVRVVTSAGLSHSIEVGHLRSSLSIDSLSDEVSALETRANTNDTAHNNMDSRLTSLELAMGEEGDGETELGFGLVKEISDIQVKLDKIQPGDITRHGDELDEIRGRLTVIDGTNGRLDVIDGTNGRLNALEEDITDLADTKLDQSTFQDAVDAGFKVIGKTPASASAEGEPGEVCWDAEYFYVCVATNTWKRTPLESW